MKKNARTRASNRRGAVIMDIKAEPANKYIEKVRAALGGGKRYFVITFGCQQNEADSERIRGLAEAMGYLPASGAEDADFIVVNTCAIREHAEMKALSLIGGFKAIKKKNPEFILGVCGCMAAEEHISKKLKEDFHFVSFTLEPNMLHKIPELVYIALAEHKRRFILGEDRGEIVEGIAPVRAEKHRAWVSVMYGCNNFCSYCIVPYVRGRERSRESSAIISECRELISGGTREITLLGQNVNSYKSDLDFPELLAKIAEIDGDFIIRFMTSHPKDTSDELIDVMAKYKDKIAPYFHLPLQSGSNKILRAMNRTYTRERFVKIADALRRSVPGIALSTDVIVGFPGESEEDFLDTLDVLGHVRFDLVYAFIYSERKGTKAAELDCSIPKEIRTERLTRLLSMQDEISLAANMPYKGKVVRVLVDGSEMREGRIVYTGRTPTNKLVHFTAQNASRGEFVLVKIERCGAFELYGAEFEG